MILLLKNANLVAKSITLTTRKMTHANASLKNLSSTRHPDCVNFQFAQQILNGILISKNVRISMDFVSVGKFITLLTKNVLTSATSLKPTSRSTIPAVVTPLTQSSTRRLENARNLFAYMANSGIEFMLDADARTGTN